MTGEERRRIATALAIALGIALHGVAGAEVSVERLRCEHAARPLGIDVRRPRFSWLLESSERDAGQFAYRVLVAASEEALARGRGDAWDSGRVESDRPVDIVYAGRPLRSRERLFWKARVWDRRGRPSAWSHAASFELGLLEPGDWRARWIAMGDVAEGGGTSPAPLLRRSFELDGEPRRARVYLSGLGYHELYLNGERVGDRVLDPAVTSYHDDQPYDMPSRVLYVTHDVTRCLHRGPNALGVALGNGWYSGVTPPQGRQPYGDRPKLLLQLEVELADGRRALVVSDRSWRCAEGPTLDNDICAGESYDARREVPGWASAGFDDARWKKVILAEPPGGRLVAQSIPPARVVETRRAVGISKPAPGIRVFDFGQNLSGWARLRARGPRGAKVTLRYSPRTGPGGRLDTRPNRGASQTDSYVLAGRGLEEWEPRFTLHGFRYVEVSGFPGEPTPESLEARVVRTALERAGGFECSNDLINRIHHNVVWTFLSSLQGIPQDAAERDERVAWLGDTGFVWEDYIYNLDMAAFSAKWLDDIRDAQRPTGEIPVTAPKWRRGGRKGRAYAPFPCWISTYPLLAWYSYWYYEDVRVLEDHYDGVAKLVAYERTQAPEHIFPYGLGDHMEPQEGGKSSFAPRHTSPQLTSTAYFYEDARLLSRMADVLGKKDDARRHGALAGEIAAAFNERFFDEEKGCYGSGTQTACALPLSLGLVSEERRERVVRHLARDIAVTSKGHLSTGIIGTNALEQTLADHGLAELMFTIATQTTPPGWGYQVRQGATTVWETWEGEPHHCRNMKMFGSIETFLYEDLAGIAPAASGFRRIAIRPHPVGDLAWVKAWHDTVRGRIAVRWRRREGSFSLEATLPPSTRAAVALPALGLEDPTVREGGRVVWTEGAYVPGVAGLSGATRERGTITFDAGSGSYSFELRKP